MTSIDELPLDQVLSAVLPTYRALDVRSIAIGHGDQWHLGAVVIYATAESVESVHDRQLRLLATQPTPQAEAFSLALEAIDASTLPAILEGLNKGRAPLQGHELN
ncbi:MAG: hypothetical protein M3082_14935 [Candidatus Dormibacteraeota bacterium]|nr:hypothetical protein [Candidatus Dormibacteraeota bacterium]